jgi:para-aminobenzoate synthetase component 1
MNAQVPSSPYFLEIPFAPPATYAARVAPLPYCLLLDSPAAHGGRYAYLAFSPRHVLTEQEGRISVDNTIVSEDIFTYLKNFQANHAIAPLPSLPPFQTGWAGYIGYDYRASLKTSFLGRLAASENLSEAARTGTYACVSEKFSFSPLIPIKGFLETPYNIVQESLNISINDQPQPAVIVCFYDIVTAFDMHEQRAWVLAHPSVENAPVKLEETARFLGTHSKELDPCLRREFASSIQKQAESPTQAGVPQSLNGLVLQPDTSPAAYQDAVEKTLAYIRAGDIYQANIAQRFSATLPEELHHDAAALFALYQQIIPLNPAPYSAFFHTPNASLLSYSPEQFLHVQGNTITTRPIKGTIPRLFDDSLDKKQQDELLSSSKNRAENLMIVDLLRNDLSRVCVAGSVHVKKLYALETFSSVHHLVSTVSGTLAPEYTAIDALRHAFPGGSITGAPKIRAMEIINELEPYARNSYCGTLFYLGCDGNMDSSILIRTLVVTAGKMTLHAGCGIVADSDPVAEYAESLAKANIFLDFFGKQSDIHSYAQLPQNNPADG